MLVVLNETCVETKITEMDNTLISAEDVGAIDVFQIAGMIQEMFRVLWLTEDVVLTVAIDAGDDG